MKKLIPVKVIEEKICMIRGQKVILDADLAAFYGVTTKRLNEQVKHNIGRFPEDFMFQLTEDELGSMRSQFATASKRNIRTAIRELMTPSEPKKKKIGFIVRERSAQYRTLSRKAGEKIS